MECFKMDNSQLGIQYMQEGKWEEAAKIFMEEIEKNPNNAVSYVNFGNVLSALGDDTRALSFYQKAIEIDDTTAAAYYSAGTVYYEKENLESAKNMFELALEKGLESSDNFFMLGLTYVGLDKGNWQSLIFKEQLN